MGKFKFGAGLTYGLSPVDVVSGLEYRVSPPATWVGLAICLGDCEKWVWALPVDVVSVPGTALA